MRVGTKVVAALLAAVISSSSAAAIYQCDTEVTPGYEWAQQHILVRVEPDFFGTTFVEEAAKPGFKWRNECRTVSHFKKWCTFKNGVMEAYTRNTKSDYNPPHYYDRFDTRALTYKTKFMQEDERPIRCRLARSEPRQPRDLPVADFRQNMQMRAA